MSPLERLRAWATRCGVALHTVQVVRRGEPLVEATCSPLTLDTPQRMFSVTKSLTGLAVGILAGEGRIALTDTVMDHFGDYAPVHPWVAATTVRDVLSMRGPHPSTTYKRYDGPWLESYFRVPPTHQPGTLFTYDTSGTYLLAALVERISGESLADYLRPRLFDPLGISPGLRIIFGPDGFSSGGSGLVCTPRDLGRLALLLVCGGSLDGLELVPHSFWAAATTPQADTTMQTWGAQLQGGYGYLTWLPRAGGWLMFGMGGQLVYGDPGRELLIVVTADTQASPGSDQSLVDLVVGDLAEAWADAAAPNERTDLAWPAPRHKPEWGRVLRGRWTPVDGGELGPLELDACLDPVGGSLRAGAAGQEGDWQIDLTCDASILVERSGMGAATNLTGPAVVSAGWSAADTLDIRVDALGDELGVLRLRVVASPDGTLTVRRQGYAEALASGWAGVASYRPVSP